MIGQIKAIIPTLLPTPAYTLVDELRKLPCRRGSMIASLVRIGDKVNMTDNRPSYITT